MVFEWFKVNVARAKRKSCKKENTGNIFLDTKKYSLKLGHFVVTVFDTKLTTLSI